MSEPEADIEYSRAHRASEGGERRRRSRSGALAAGLLAGGLLGALLLLVAEFTPLLHVHSTARGSGIFKTIGTGSHHSYALIPVALLAMGLTLAARAPRNRLALGAIGLLGVVALAIALLGDLPDARATGLIRQANGTYASGSSSAAAGLYLESLGAVVLIFTAGTGLLMGPRPPAAPARRRSAS